MDFQLLKLRLDRIKAQRNSLSAEDILILLTKEKADLNSGFFSRLFTVSAPAKWEFSSASSQHIQLSLELIELVEDVLIPYYSYDSNKHAWFAQCILFRLNHQPYVNITKIINQDLAKIENTENLQLGREILKILYERQSNASTLLALAKIYKKSALYTDAIQYFEHYLEQYHYAEEVFFQYIECLILRNNHIYREAKGEFSDLHYAVYLLSQLKNVQDQTTYHVLINRAITGLMPGQILVTRAEETNIFADMGRGLNNFSKWLGKEFGGRESEIPYSKGIIASAPKLLSNPQIVEFLENDKKAQHDLEKILSDKGLKATVGAAAATYSVGLIWNYAHIDPAVLEALSFASKGNPEQFSSLQDISASTLESAGAVTRLTGYVAEQQVAMNLQQQGHVVELPDHANQAGYDLIVDGTPMQVKCSMDADYVLSHFDKYSDIPVIVNSELAEQLGDHPMVMVDPALSYEAVQETTNLSLTQISDFDSLGDALPIPVLTIAFAAYRNFGELGAGKIDGKQYFENVGKETAAIAGGAMVGKVLLGTVGGLVAGPVGVALAGGLGAYIGGVAGSTGANSMNRDQLCDQRDVVVKLLIQFASWFNHKLLAYRVQVLEQQLNQFENYLKQGEEAIALSSTLFSYQFEMYARALHLKNWLTQKTQQGNEIEKVQAGWVALNESSHFMSVELRQKVAEINRELEIYKRLANPEAPNQTVQQLGHA